jgi:hypothetical protein
MRSDRVRGQCPAARAKLLGLGFGVSMALPVCDQRGCSRTTCAAMTAILSCSASPSKRTRTRYQRGALAGAPAMTELVSLPSVARSHFDGEQHRQSCIVAVGTSAGGFEAQNHRNLSKRICSPTRSRLAVSSEQDGYLHDHYPRTPYG